MSGEVEHAASGEGSDAPPQVSVGRLLAGRYRIHSVLGEGGMAIVYEGEHIGIGKRVAIKLVQSLFARDDEIVNRFEAEARAASAVESEHIVHVFDVGADPELGLFLVMELLKGQDLGRVLARRGALDPVFACALIKQAALGLEKAHSAGIVHRDLKPANVFLVDRDDGTTLVKLVDFGIAKVVREAHDARFSRKGITRRGTAIGTPQYMSPEQAQGLETVDHRTDVFTLGAVLFEAIAGRPYMAERATYEQTILQLITTPAPRLSTVVPDIPPALDQLVADMMEHDPARRVQDMHTVRERLAAIYPELQGSSVKLKSLPPPSAPSLDRYVVHASANPHYPTVPGTSAAIILPRDRRPVLFVASLAVLLGVGLGLLALSRSNPAPAAAPLPSVLVAPAPSPVIPPPPALPSVTPSASASAPAGQASAAASGLGGHLPPPFPSKKPAPARPTDQVGAAGISSQF